MRTLLIAALTAASLAAQQAAPAFEVASVKPHEGRLSIMHTMTVSGTGVRFQGYTPAMLVDEAYGVKYFQMEISDAVKNNPDSETYYDIEARVSGDKPLSKAEARIMLRKLLADRFHAKLHRSSKEFAVHGLAVAKGGSRLKENTTDAPCAGSMNASGRIYAVKITACPIADLVQLLESLVNDRPIVDRTGLTGKYDASVAATPDWMRQQETGPNDVSPISAVADLGLKLEPTKATFETIVFDSFEKATQN